MSVMPLLRKAEKMLHVAASVIIGTSSRAEKKCLCREAAADGYVSFITPEGSRSGFPDSLS